MRDVDAKLTSTRQRLPLGAVLVVLLTFAFASSYYGWRHSPHARGLRQVYPSWYYGDYVIFDNYGPYSQWIAATLLGLPGAEKHFAEFIRHDLHAHTPFYPFLCALVYIVVGNVVVAHLLVTLTASAVALWLFWRLIPLMAPTQDLSHRVLGLVCFVLHPGVTSSLARPMPDSLALALMIAIFLLLARFAQTWRRRYLFWASVATLVAMFTKTILILLLPTFLAWTLGIHRDLDGGRRRRLLRWMGLSFVLACAVVGGLWLALSGTGAMRFLATACQIALRDLAHPLSLLKHAPAFFFFLMIGFGGYPLLWWVSRKTHGKPSSLAHHAAWFHGAWVGVYVAQRIMHAGFNLAYGRARYTMPLAPSVVVLSLPALHDLWERGGRWRVLACLPPLFHLGIWLAYLATLQGGLSER